VAVIADKTSNPEFVAADLLSQAEHGSDSQVLLVSTDKEILLKTKEAVSKQVAVLPRQTFAQKALDNSKFVLLKNDTELINFINEYAAEHLIIATDNHLEIAAKIVNAGSIFLGHYTPEAAGDYASGTNHTLPTNGYARAYSGVSVDSFVKKVTFQSITKEGIQNIGKTIEIMAEAEQLMAHKNAVSVRLKGV
jgi:histidinol dehydrogenase